MKPDAENSSEANEQVYARIPVSLVKELETRCTELRLSRPAGVAAAIRHWLTADEDREEIATPKSADNLPGFTEEEFAALRTFLQGKNATATMLRGIIKGAVAEILSKREGKS